MTEILNPRHKMAPGMGFGGLEPMLWRHIEFESWLWHKPSDLGQFTYPLTKCAHLLNGYNIDLLVGGTER